jgi:SOS-response transcriptional repressor LexA
MDIEWIREGLKKPGKSKIGLAKALGKAPNAVTGILQGWRQLKAKEIDIIAKYLEVDSPFIENVTSTPIIKTAYITGEVAAGVWSEPDILFEPIPTTVAVDNRWPEKSVFLLRVKGNSINRQAKDGDLVLCLDIHAAPRDFQAGDWVIAERTGADGRIEMTVKRVEGSRLNGYKLSPDSDDPKFQTSLILGKNNGDTVVVKAYVIEFIKKATNFI